MPNTPIPARRRKDKVWTARLDQAQLDVVNDAYARHCELAGDSALKESDFARAIVLTGAPICAGQSARELAQTMLPPA